MNALELARRPRRRLRLHLPPLGAAAPRGLLSHVHQRLPDAGDARARDPARHAVPRAATSTGSWRASDVFLSPVLRPVERGDLPRLRHRRDGRAGLEGLRRRRPGRWPFVAIVAGYVVLPPPGRPAAQPGRHPADVARTSRSTRRSASRPTRTGRTTRARPARRYLTQAAVLAVRNFTSAATGLAVAIALIRGLTRRSAKTLGNYWVDLTRGVLYILLPISIVGALVLVWQGVPQTWNRPADGHDPRRAPSRRSPSARSPPRNGSRSWATTAAASSTPTRPTRSRARRRSPTGSRSSPCS